LKVYSIVVINLLNKIQTAIYRQFMSSVCIFQGKLSRSFRILRVGLRDLGSSGHPAVKRLDEYIFILTKSATATATATASSVPTIASSSSLAVESTPASISKSLSPLRALPLVSALLTDTAVLSASPPRPLTKSPGQTVLLLALSYIFVLSLLFTQLLFIFVSRHVQKLNGWTT